ncbi:hypothetical protein [Flexivirga caeni]|nr:hypothetical protein [Flexivirga caeni]
MPFDKFRSRCRSDAYFDFAGSMAPRRGMLHEPFSKSRLERPGYVRLVIRVEHGDYAAIEGMR